MRRMITAAALALGAALAGCETTEPIGPDPSGGSGAGDAGAPPDHVDGSRLKARWIAAGDGSRERVGWTDTERGEACAFRTAADGLLRCLPEARGKIPVDQIGRPEYFSDAACSQPVARVPEGCDAPAYASLQRACGGEVIRRIEGAPLSEVFIAGGAGCVAQAVATEGNDTHHATVEIEAGAFQDAAPEP